MQFIRQGDETYIERDNGDSVGSVQKCSPGTELGWLFVPWALDALTKYELAEIVAYMDYL